MQLLVSHERQKDYYDRRTQGTRYSVGDSVWLWSPVPNKRVALKFHEPWTGPVEVSKRLSDVIYELLDVAKNSNKIVHFDCLKKATVNSRPQLPDKSESDSKSSTDDSLVDVNFNAKQTKKRNFLA